MCGRGPPLNEFSNRNAPLRGQSPAVGLDAVYLVKGVRRQVRRATVRTGDDGDVFDDQQAGALTVAASAL